MPKSTRRTTSSAPSSPSSPHADSDHITITAIGEAANHKKKVDLQTSWAALIAGLLANYGPDDTFVIMDQTLTRDEVLKHLRRYIAAAERTKVSRKAYLEAVQAEHQTYAALRTTRDGIVSIVRARHGKTSQRLLQYGIAPARPKRKSAAAKSAAVEKAQATRALRGTKGRRQRLAIKAGLIPPGSPAPEAAPPNVAPPSAATTAPPLATAAPSPSKANGMTRPAGESI